MAPHRPKYPAFLAGLVTLLVLMPTGLLASALDENEMATFKAFLPAVLEVQVKGAQCEDGGTAFFVSPDGVAVTNKHVLKCLISPKGSPDAKIQFRFHVDAPQAILTSPKTNSREDLQSALRSRSVTSSKIEIGACGKTAARDLCIIRLPGMYPHRNFSIGTEFPKEGAQVFTIGNPFGKGLMIDSGTFLARRNHDGVSEVDVSIPTRPGNSGGPVFLQDGTVVGIHYLLRTHKINVGPKDGWKADRVEHNAISAFEIKSLLDHFYADGGHFLSPADFASKISPGLIW